ncbi:MAG: glycosyltransferase [Gammaproteobacteria bacterium]|nr:glycosyltransferase [Gammaproteobacteria bacterium]MDQ5899170.1 hypothetical protein [Pseudomonadota bacterium]
MSEPRILINIVLYNSDKNKILELIRICLDYEQVKILLFDNASDNHSLNYIDSEKVILYKSTKNVGIAGAHYYACEMAESENFDFVLFLDQDTQLPEYFVNSMILEFYQLQKIHSRLVAIGPLWKDPRVYDWYQKKFNKFKKFKKFKKFVKKVLNKRFKITSKIDNIYRVNNVIISSGMLVLVKSLKNIGYPKKEYFIDLVDLEWCLRALSKDYHVERLKKIQIQHTIGEIKINKNSFMLYQNPMRYYYAIRNSFFLFREKKYPFDFRFFILIRNILEIKKIPFVPEPKKSLLAAIRGIKDGIYKKSSEIN